MKTVELGKATASLAEYARRARREPVVLTVGGKPVAVLVVIKNADLETAALSTDPKFVALIERSRARLKAEGGLSSDEMRRRLGAKPRRDNGR